MSLHLQLLAAALHAQRDGVAGLVLHDLHEEVEEVAHRPALNGRDHVVDLQDFLRGAVRLELRHARAFPARDRSAVHARPGLADLRRGQQRGEDVARAVNRDREADPLRAVHDRAVDADQLAQDVDQRAAAVAGIDQRAGLDEAGVMDGVVAGADGDLAVQRRDDAGGDGVLEAERDCRRR